MTGTRTSGIRKRAQPAPHSPGAERGRYADDQGAPAWRESTVRRLLAGHALELASNETDLSAEGVA